MDKGAGPILWRHILGTYCTAFRMGFREIARLMILRVEEGKCVLKHTSKILQRKKPRSTNDVYYYYKACILALIRSCADQTLHTAIE